MSGTGPGRVRLTIDDEGIADLWLADEAGDNAFSRELVAELLAALTATDVPSCKVVVIRGLARVFSAGGDRALLLELADRKLAPYDLTLTRALLEVPVPTIAAVEGHAIGGGLTFAIACDLVILGAHSRYGCNFMELGFTPGMGTTRLLQAAFGEYWAAELMYSARYVRGSELAGRSLVNAVLPNDRVLAHARALAGRIADKPARALRLLKRALAGPRRERFEQALREEALMHELCFGDPATRARLAERYGPLGAGPTAAEAPAEPRPESNPPPKERRR